MISARLGPPFALALLAACGERHAGVDGGADAYVPVARSCRALSEAPEGAPCDVPVPCSEESDGFCAVRRSSCADGRTEHADHAWVFHGGDGRACAEGSAAIDATGGAPLRFTRGSASEEGGFTNSILLLLTPAEAAFFECPVPRLSVSFAPNLEGVYEGTLDAAGALTTEGSREPLAGTVEITLHGPDSGTLVGRVDLASDTREVSGSFELLVCPELYRPSL